MVTEVGPKTDQHATEAPPAEQAPDAAMYDRKSGDACRCQEHGLAANACGFGSAGSVDERRLFEAELVVLATSAPKPEAKPPQRRILKTCLSTTVRSPAGPNVLDNALPREKTRSSRGTPRESR